MREPTTNEYLVDFVSDGAHYSARIEAVSAYHASLLVEDPKATATLLGKLEDVQWPT